jgi:hypothetical protein
LSIKTSLTTCLAETPAGRGFVVETVNGGKTSRVGLTDTPGAIEVALGEGLAEAEGILAGALAQAAVQTTISPTPTDSTARCDRPQPVTWRPLES